MTSQKFSLKSSRGFTLIELLVVVSIISMLSSVVMASVQGARDKAQVGAGLQFAGHNYHALGTDAIVMYDFNDVNGSGNFYLKDSSGNNRTAVLSGVCQENLATYCKSSLTPSNSGSSLYFDQIADYGDSVYYDSTIPGNSPISMAGATSFTFSLWVRPTTQCPACSTGLPTIFYLTGLKFGLSLSGSNFYIDVPTGGGNLFIAATPNKWQHIAISFNDTTDKVDFYINGRKTGPNVTYSAAVPPSITGIYFGSAIGSVPLSSFFSGYIDDFAMYSQSLTASQIEQIYAAGLPEHTVAVE